MVSLIPHHDSHGVRTVEPRRIAVTPGVEWLGRTLSLRTPRVNPPVWPTGKHWSRLAEVSGRQPVTAKK